MMKFIKNKNKSYSFASLNITQFLGALNDNVFKLLIIYFLIQVQGPERAPIILALAGVFFVLPFLIFSSAAGVLADKFSKSNIIVAMKFAEILVMATSVVAFITKSEFFVYSLLFLMAAQSAFFGPSKFGIIPEIVDEKKVSKANGILASCTYLAIIIGTFLASFIADITNKNFVLAAFICVGISIIGFFSSFGIKKTIPRRTTTKINPLFLYEIYKTLRLAYKRKHLLTCIIGCSFFLFVGAYVQLNTIPFAMQSLGLTDVQGGYLFLSTAIGIALGSIFAGKISKDKIEIGLSCVSGFFIAVMFLCLFLFSKFLYLTILFLIILGIFGGMFLIPLESFIQVKSPDKRRGQIIAASNFLSFFGVMIASGFLYLISSKLKFSASSGFGITSLVAFFVTFVLSAKMSDLFFPYLAERIISKKWPLHDTVDVPDNKKVLFLERRSWIDILFLYSIMPKLKIIVIGHFYDQFPYVNGFVNTIFRLAPNRVDTELLKKIEKRKDFDTHMLIVAKDLSQLPESLQKDVIRVNVKKELVQKIWWRLIYFQRQYMISFS
jgi:acyl-[acyl-carrier-protein]-phospholipid O-acyltransferase / long-chain-fatty-acid--[acyl-carrier-protein] ligase